MIEHYDKPIIEHVYEEPAPIIKHVYDEPEVIKHVYEQPEVQRVTHVVHHDSEEECESAACKFARIVK